MSSAIIARCTTGLEPDCQKGESKERRNGFEYLIEEVE